ncbi:enoyl-CoA hydratase domain-containing protein 3, mitochondrial [Atheta coriaria]|uniref:enoyl-CoA hydratase domain-containing protein 3, mitochondrial n=1 Tax=Dalotia coriaria TaxID=877792 RepID=UPI0031F3B6FB
MLFRSALTQLQRRLYSQHASKLTNVTNNEGVKTITMCNPKTGNCLSIPMMQELISNISAEWECKDLRVIVLAAEGKIFSSGHDLKELSEEAGRESQEKVFSVASSLMRSIIECPVPIIAAVNGYAVASGCQLVAQCDLAVCTDISKFSTPGVNVGIFCSTPGVALARSVPKATTLKMLFTGKPIGAEEAVQTGLVSHCCSKEDFDKVLDELCADIVRKSRAVVEMGKRFYYKQIDQDIMTAYKNGGRVMVENLNLADGIEGVNSFVDKRKPKWTHS